MSNEPNINIEVVEPTSAVSPNQGEVNIEAMIKQYVAEHKPRLAILTPCYGSLCFVNYVSCLINTMNFLHGVGIPVKVEFCRNDSLVSRARNNLIAKVMNDPTVTHFMFIDNDITWSPIDIIKLLIADKPLVGGIYPIKNFDWSKLLANPTVVQDWLKKKNESQLASMMTDEDFIQYRMVRYNVNHLGPNLVIKQNLAQVKHLATGFMMIQRSVIEKMSKAFPSTKYVDDVGFLHGSENDFAYALFDCGVEEGHYCSEDWLFCNRWTKMGGQVWMDVSINLVHTGNQDFKGSFISSLV
jgi:hypothetical protein